MPPLPTEEADVRRVSPDKPLRGLPAWTTNRPLRRLLALLTLGIGLIASLLGGLLVKRSIEEDAAAAFAKTCDEITLRINERLTAYAVLLQGAKALFGASEQVTRDEWRTYVEMLRATDIVPGYQGIGFTTLIKPEDLEAHEKQVRSEGFPDYKVHPRGQRDIYSSIVFLEPFSGRNLRAFGYDMFSEPVRHKAMERACETGNPALTGKVTLVQEDGHDVQAGTLMYLPVYRKNAPTDTGAEKRAALIGWVYSPYRMDDLMRGTIPEVVNGRGKSIDVAIYDGERPVEDALLFDSRRSVEPPKRKPMVHGDRSIDFHGSRWLLVFQGSPAGGFDLTPAWVTGAAGLVITALVFGMLIAIYKRSDAQLTTQRLADQIRGMAFYDALTKLPNRVLLRDRLEMALAGAKRTGHRGAVLMVDLDNFKPLNDKHGHAAGDALLVEVAQRLRGCVRETDTVARLGGDEFLVLLGTLAQEETDARAEALAVAQKICHTLAQPYVISLENTGEDLIEHRCSASIGVVLFSGDEESQSGIIRSADQAMYRAKKEGRNRVWVHSPHNGQHTAGRETLS